jgi:hypothetical protein
MHPRPARLWGPYKRYVLNIVINTPEIGDLLFSIGLVLFLLLLSCVDEAEGEMWICEQVGDYSGSVSQKRHWDQSNGRPPVVK